MVNSVGNIKLPYWFYKRSMPNLSPNSLFNGRGQTIKKSSCAPAAVANIIFYLSSSNRRFLVPSQGNHSIEYVKGKLIETLSKLMKTDRTGTVMPDLIEGLEKYVIDRGYKVSHRWYQTAELNPEIIMSTVLGDSNSILWNGQYVQTDVNRFKRIEGHAVTLAGFNTRLSELLVHDCSFMKKPHSIEIVLTEKYTTFVHKGLPQRKSSFCKLKDFADEREMTVIEEVLSFEINPK